MEDYVTRREMDQIRVDLSDTRHSVDLLKTENAAIGVLSTQISIVTRDLSELKSDMNYKFTKHEQVHEADEKARTSGRRWLIGTAISALAIVAGLYGWVALLIHR